MNAPIALVQLDRGTKRCRDCAHCQRDANTVLDRCGRSVIENYATGETGYLFCNIARDSTRDAACGPRAVHFAASEDYLAARSVRRIQNLRAIEDAISALNPDAYDAQQILDAVTASLKSRYEDCARDALECADDFRKALDEVQEPEIVAA